MPFLDFVGMRIVARMGEPVIPGVDGIHIDGVIALGHWNSLDERTRRRTPPVDSDSVIDFKLPLARWAVEMLPDDDVSSSLRRRSDGMIWGWVASRQLGEPAITGSHDVRKRPATGEMVNLTSAKSANIGSGAMKAYNLSFQSIFSRTMAWVAVGNVDRVRSLLGHVYAIGKKTSTGSGRVLSWVVERDSSVTIDSVCARRRMPVPGGVRRMGVRPPYHHHLRCAPC